MLHKKRKQKMTVDWRTAQQLFDADVVKESQKHSESVYPDESVGIIVDGKYIAIENAHKDPLNNFKIHPDILVKYANKIQAVIHSHPLENHPGHPSEADMTTQLKWNIPFGIQLINESGAGNILWFGDQIPTADLVGRPYIFGVYDCFSIWRDYYRIELSINIPEIPRSDYFWKDGEDLYRKHATNLGFVEVDPNNMQKHDVVLIKLRARVPNHAILYLGGDSGLHHMPFKLSCNETISRYINPNKEMFDSVWRFKGITK
jgi:proteasome lid subunit RPN8/RPN11